MNKLDRDQRVEKVGELDRRVDDLDCRLDDIETKN